MYRYRTSHIAFNVVDIILCIKPILSQGIWKLENWWLHVVYLIHQ